jgi:hypothetical protein
MSGVLLFIFNLFSLKYVFLFFPHIYIKQIDMNTKKNNNDRLIINHKYYQDLSKFDNLSQNEMDL